MAGLAFCSGSAAAATWQYHPIVLSSAPKSGNRFRFDELHAHDSDPDRQKQFWQDLFSTPSELWGNRLVKRSPIHPGFRHNVAGDQWVKVKQPTMLYPRPDSSAAQLASPTAGDENGMPYEEGQLDRTLDAMLQRDQYGVVPSVHMYKSLLKACARRKALAQAKRVHAHIAKYELESTILGEFLVTTLAKCGGLEDALELFYRLPHRSVYSWTALMSAYTTAGHGLDAIEMYCNMLEEGLQPNKHTFVSCLRACTSLSDLNMGRRIHSETLKFRCDSDLYVGTCLLHMYSNCGSILDVQDVFHRLSEHDVVSWTAIIVAHAQQGQPEMALGLYQEMLKGGVSPSHRTLVGTLQVHSMLAEQEGGVAMGGRSIKSKALEKGKAIHAHCQKKGYDAGIFFRNILNTRPSREGFAAI